MIEILKETWKKNHGNMLATIALSMSLLVCGLWYFNLLPEIELEPPQVLGDQISSTQRQPVVLQVNITTPEDLPEQKIDGFVEILTTSGTLDAPAERLSTHAFSADRGGMAAVLLEHLPQGRYALLAYLDLNKNNALDFEDGKAAEPVRTATATAFTPGDYELSANAIQLEVGRPQFVFLKF